MATTNTSPTDFHKYEWPSHVTCFHTTVQEWHQCFFTCPEEIEEYAEKIKADTI